jgi:aquaporin related protein
MPDKEISRWRRILRLPNRSLRLPRYSTELKITTSRGQAYLLDQFRERVPENIKNHFVAALSEFVGTFLYMLTGLGGTSAAISLSSNDPDNPVKYLYIATSWGMSTAVNAWVFFRISGGLFNPAVTIAMMMIKAVSPYRGVLIILTQVVACIAASGVLMRLVPPETVSMTELGEGTSVVQGLFIEMFLTAQVVFSIFMLATEKHKATYIAPLGIGLAVSAAVLM